MLCGSELTNMNNKKGGRKDPVGLCGTLVAIEDFTENGSSFWVQLKNPRRE